MYKIKILNFIPTLNEQLTYKHLHKPNCTLREIGRESVAKLEHNSAE